MTTTCVTVADLAGQRCLSVTAVLSLCLLACSAAAGAQGATPSSIRVTGTSSVTVKPDRVRVDVGVVTQSRESQDAVSQNAATFSAVLAALRKTLGTSADISSLSYSLNPDYQYRPNEGQPTITGYTATNIVRVTTDDLARIGDVIDTASRAGANRVPSVQFTLRDEQAVRTRALKEAAVRAKSEADALASALGLRIIRILSVDEGGPVVVPVRDVMFAKAAAPGSAATSIQSGTIEVNANVTLAVEVSDRQ